MKLTSPITLPAGLFAEASRFAPSFGEAATGAPPSALRWMFGFPLQQRIFYGGKWHEMPSVADARGALEEQFGFSDRRFLPDVKLKHEAEDPKNVGRLLRYAIVTRAEAAAKGVTMPYAVAVFFGAELQPDWRALFDRGEARFCSPELRLNTSDEHGPRLMLVAEMSFVGIPHFKGQPPLDEMRGIQFSEGPLGPATPEAPVTPEQIKAMQDKMAALEAENAELKAKLAAKTGGDSMPASDAAAAAPVPTTMQTGDKAGGAFGLVIKAQEDRIKVLEKTAAKAEVRAKFAEKNVAVDDKELESFVGLYQNDRPSFDFLLEKMPAGQSRTFGDRKSGAGEGNKAEPDEASLSFGEMTPKQRKVAINKYIEAHKLTGDDAYDIAYAAVANKR